MPNNPGDWLEAADLTYCSARLIFLKRNPFLWFDAAYLLHQALEKYGKALLSSKGVARLGHDLSTLSREIAEHFPEIDTAKVQSFISSLDHLQTLRYPDMQFSGEGLGQEELQDADLIVRLLRERVPESISSRGIGRILHSPIENFHLQLIWIVLKDNGEWEYWKRQFEGISSEIDSFLDEAVSRSRGNDVSPA